MALVLVVIVVAAGGAAGFYYYMLRPLSPASTLQCNNGATNYPSCSTCPSGQNLVSGTCRSVCSNGANNYPTCLRNTSTTVDCPSSTMTTAQTLVCTITVADISQGSILAPTGTVAIDAPPPPSSGSCTLSGGSCTFQYQSTQAGTFSITASYGGDSNHSSSQGQFTVTVTPASCSNGANNPPQCTMWSTTTTVTCSPGTIENHELTSTNCTAYVTSNAPTVPTGNVGFTATGTWYLPSDTANPCVLKTFSADEAYCEIDGITTSSSAGTMTIYGAYSGDSNGHSSSTGSFDLTVTNPPSTVTVSGTVTNVGGSTPSQVQFINKVTGTGYTTQVTSGYYSISLANLTDYYVVQYFSNSFGTGQCNMGTLSLQSPTSTATYDWSC